MKGRRCLDLYVHIWKRRMYCTFFCVCVFLSNFFFLDYFNLSRVCVCVYVHVCVTVLRLFHSTLQDSHTPISKQKLTVKVDYGISSKASVLIHEKKIHIFSCYHWTLRCTPKIHHNSFIIKQNT